MEPRLLEVTRPFRLPEDNGCCHAGYYAVAAKVQHNNSYIAYEIHVSEDPILLGDVVEYKDIPLQIHISDHAHQMAEHILALSRRLGENASGFFRITGPPRIDS